MHGVWLLLLLDGMEESDHSIITGYRYPIEIPGFLAILSGKVGKQKKSVGPHTRIASRYNAIAEVIYPMMEIRNANFWKIPT